MKLEQVRLEAIGTRGEACVIVRTGAAPGAAGEPAPTQEGHSTFRLATGERLQPTETPGVFATLDGARRFTLRVATTREL